MSLTLPTQSGGPPSDEPSDLTIKEMASYGPAKRSVAQYEFRIRELSDDNKRLRESNDRLDVELKRELKFRAAHAQMKRGKVEAVVQFATGSILTGGGALLMGIFPRLPVDTSLWFWVGSTLVAVGVVLGVAVRPITLILCHVWPKFCDPNRFDLD